MKGIIQHEIPGRIRFNIPDVSLSIEMADVLDAYLHLTKGVKAASVHERTGNVIVFFEPTMRSNIIQAISRFSFTSEETHNLLSVIPAHSSRIIDRECSEKLVFKIIKHFVKTTFLPLPVRVLITTINSIPYIINGLKSLFSKKIDVDLLDAVAISVSLLRNDFKTAGSIMFLLGLGELLEDWTRKRSMDDLAKFLSLGVDKVWVKTTTGELLVPINEVQQDDIVIVRLGNLVPFDGIILDGEISVNQSSLTGESLAVHKKIGSTIFAGSTVEEGECEIKVTHIAGQSKYDKILTMIENSEALNSKSIDSAVHLADKLVPYSLFGSLAVFLLTRNATAALAVLMADFSCALKLSMPLAVISAMREAARHNVTVKGGSYLESFSKVDTLVFDKTGTLTYANPSVVKVIPFAGQDENEMVRIAACLEEHFPHSMANAVVKYAADKGLEHDEFHQEVQYIVAHGISGMINEDKVLIGSSHFIFDDENCTVLEEDQELFDTLPDEYSLLYMAISGTVVAVICIFDPIRAEANQVMEDLKRLGVKRIVMLTGDNKKTASKIASQIGCDEYLAEVLPEEKAIYVQKAQELGDLVVMVGDGVNDSPALSAADVGIAISDGSAIAREISDITIAAENLNELVFLKAISNQLSNRIEKTYDQVIGINTMLIALGVFGVITPALSSLLHNASTLLISMNNMTPLLKDGAIDFEQKNKGIEP